MKRFPLLATLAAALFFPLLSRGGQAPSRDLGHRFTGDLTLTQAVQIALRQSPDILKQIQEIERTRGQIIEIRGQALPHLVVAGSFAQQDRQLFESVGGTSSGGSGGNTIVVLPSTATAGSGTSSTTVTSGASTLSSADLSAISKAVGNSGGGSGSGIGLYDKSWKVDIELQQVLYAGGAVGAAIRIAKLTDDSSYFQLRDTVDLVVSRTKSQFFEVLLDRALIKVQEESIQLLSDQLKDQQNRFEAGTVPRFNVLRAEVALSNARPDLIRARNAYLIAQITLARTLNLDPGPDGKPTFHCVGEFQIVERPLGLVNALEIARERRAFLKVQRQQILINKENIKVQLAGYKPRIDANATYEFRNSSRTDDLDQVVNGWFYGISGTWNIFDGFETAGRVKQARAQLESARITYEDSVHQVELEVGQAYANLQAARETIRSQQKSVEQALEALRLASERFSAGAGTQLDVLDARVALTQARTTEIQARSDYNVQLAEFDRVTATDTIYDEVFEDPLAPRTARKPAPLKDSAPVKKTRVKPAQ